MPRRTGPGKRISRLRQRGRETERVARAQQLRKPAEPEPPAGLLRRTFRDHTWLTGALGVALGAFLTIVGTKLPGDFVNVPALRDELRSGPDVSSAVMPVYLDDEGRTKATRTEYRPNRRMLDALGRPGMAASPEFENAMQEAEAVHVDKLTLRLVLTAHRNQQVNVIDITPEIVERSAPWSGTLFSVPSEAGSPTMNMIFDMDRPLPVARDAAFDDKTNELVGGKPFFAQRTITLRDTKQQVVFVRATADRHYVAFRLKVTYMLGGQRKTTTVDDLGRPFRLTAFKGDQEQGTADYPRVFSLQGDFSLCQSLPATPRCEA
ncbi:hypothetical protein ACSMX9_16325 [Streptomyces sp. LE64]|uniref:hypothetical protein n=1 Tax=Streptomyces sp. LE64 TaxID=3448653 RepID=UPI0040435C75